LRSGGTGWPVLPGREARDAFARLGGKTRRRTCASKWGNPQDPTLAGGQRPAPKTRIVPISYESRLVVADTLGTSQDRGEATCAEALATRRRCDSYKATSAAATMGYGAALRVPSRSHRADARTLLPWWRESSRWQAPSARPAKAAIACRYAVRHGTGAPYQPSPACAPLPGCTCAAACLRTA
jgi:hypothetical protein